MYTFYALLLRLLMVIFALTSGFPINSNEDRLYDSNYFCPLPQSLQCPILPNPLPYLLWLARWGWPSTSTLTSLPNASPSPPPLHTQLLYFIYIPLYAPLLNMTVYTSSHYIYPPISIPLWQFVCKSSAHVNHRSHAFLSFFTSTSFAISEVYILPCVCVHQFTHKSRVSGYVCKDWNNCNLYLYVALSLIILSMLWEKCTHTGLLK